MSDQPFASKSATTTTFSQVSDEFGASHNRSASTTINSNKLPLNWGDISLVGRETEVKTLVEAYERIRGKGASAELVLLRGEAGTGKSSLVQYVERKEKKGKEFFVTGKYGQLGEGDEAHPYCAIVDATTGLCFNISDDVGLRNQIRTRVQGNLTADEIRLLTKIVPTVEFIVPVRSETSTTVASQQTSMRFLCTYRKFLRCVCDDDHPLVLFLDDLQWADDASRQLIDSIVSDSKMQNMLLIGAVREDEKSIFELATDAVLKSSQIELQALSEETVNEIVSKAAARQPDDTVELSAVVCRKTGGNAYFVVQYVEMLHREELLVFSFKTNRWEWDLEVIKARTCVSDNLVEVLVQKIEAMSREVQIVLMVAACLGSSVKVEVLESVLGSEGILDSLNPWTAGHGGEKQALPTINKTATREAIVAATRANLLEETINGSIRFSHDRVQQSAFSILPSGDKARRLQARIGETLLRLIDSEKSSDDWMLFTATDLLSKHNYNGTQLSGEEIADLCLEAAQKAADKAAFRSAARYADAGIRLLSSASFPGQRYELLLALSNLSAEMHYSRGSFDRSNEIIQSILQKSRSVEDCFRAYNISLDTYASQQDWEGAVLRGSELVRELGVSLPKNPNILNVISLVIKVKRRLGGRKATDLENLPIMTNPRMEEALRLLSTTAFSAWHNGEDNRVSYLSLTMFLITLDHGICVDSPYAFAAYGLCMAHLGKLDEAYEYGTLSLRMLQMDGMKPTIAKVTVVVHGFLSYLRKPIQDSLDPLLRGFSYGMESGDVIQAAFCLRARAAIGIFAGMQLADHER